MERISVWMIRNNVENIPQHALPPGYRIRNFESGDRQTWMEVCFEAGLFDTLEKAAEQFDKEFAGREDEMAERCFFVTDESTGLAVGTTTAWYDLDWRGSGLDYGRIHWVGVRRDYQGRKLARPMLTHAMNFIASRYARARLATNTGCVRAIGIYLDFGFEPDLATDHWEQAWEYIARQSRHPKLAGFIKQG